MEALNSGPGAGVGGGRPDGEGNGLDHNHFAASSEKDVGHGRHCARPICYHAKTLVALCEQSSWMNGVCGAGLRPTFTAGN